MWVTSGPNLRQRTNSTSWGSYTAEIDSDIVAFPDRLARSTSINEAQNSPLPIPNNGQVVGQLVEREINGLAPLKDSLNDAGRQECESNDAIDVGIVDAIFLGNRVLSCAAC